MDDAELLHRYVAERNDHAFAELVRRHIDMVYGVARRQLAGDEHRAKDVSQAVFTLLARKASQLRQHPRLAGWLHRATTLTVRDQRRAERRRQLHEQEAVAMQQHASPPGADLAPLRPVFDEALGQLREVDRHLVLARYFSNRSYAELGRELSISEDAARMRSDRALDKLRRILERRGLTSTTAALTALCASEAAIGAPAGLAASVAPAALAAAGTAVGSTLSLTSFLHAMSTIKASAVLAGVVMIAAGTWTIHQQRETAQLRDEVEALESDHRAVAALRRENVQLQQDKAAAEHRADAEHAELIRIRQAIVAKREAAARATAGAAAGRREGDPTTPDDKGMIPVDFMANAGHSTPSATAQTELWAAQHGEIDQLAALISFEPADRARLESLIATLPDKIRTEYGTPERLMAFIMSGSPRPISGVKLIDQSTPDADTVIHHVQVQYASGETNSDDVKYRRTHDGWQHVISPSIVDRVVGYFGHHP